MTMYHALAALSLFGVMLGLYLVVRGSWIAPVMVIVNAAFLGRALAKVIG